MRFLLLTLAFLLSHNSWAQLFGPSFEPGSYVLADSHTVRHEGLLRLPGGPRLTVKSTDGKTIKLKPEQVLSFRIGNLTYKTVRNFHVKSGLGGTDVEYGFVEQLDSGQVLLMRYDYIVGTGMNGGTSSVSAYLVSRPSDSFPVSMQGTKQRFIELIKPFLADRPDLMKLLEDKSFTYNDLPLIVRSINSGKPLYDTKHKEKKEKVTESPFGN